MVSPECVFAWFQDSFSIARTIILDSLIDILAAKSLYFKEIVGAHVKISPFQPETVGLLRLQNGGKVIYHKQWQGPLT
jgi:hypothetical protein